MIKSSAFVLVGLLFSMSAGYAAGDGTVKPGILDQEEFNSGKSLCSYDALVISDLTVDDAEVQRVDMDNDEEKKEFLKIRGLMVDSFSDELAHSLKNKNLFKKVYRNKADTRDGAVTFEGGFVSIDPGSRAARFWIGFAGSAIVSIKGRFVDASTGESLVKIRQRRTSPLSWSGNETVLVEDTKEIAQDVALFIETLCRTRSPGKADASSPASAQRPTAPAMDAPEK